MHKFKIIADTSCDFTLDLYKENDIDFLPFLYSFDGDKYYRELVDMTNDQFYEGLIASKTAVKTSLQSVEAFRLAAYPYVEKGQDVIIATISLKFSGMFQSAMAAAELLKESNPDVNVYVVDSQLCTGGFALLLWKLVEFRNSGMSADDAYNEILKYIPGTLITFTPDTLEYLQRGGRIGKGKAYIGALLNIKPVMQMFDGELQPVTKARGRKKAIASVLDSHMKKIADVSEHDWVVIHSYTPDEAAQFQKDVESKYGIEFVHEPVAIGTTIGVHIGPGVVGLCSCPKTV